MKHEVKLSFFTSECHCNHSDYIDLPVMLHFADNHEQVIGWTTDAVNEPVGNKTTIVTVSTHLSEIRERALSKLLSDIASRNATVVPEFLDNYIPVAICVFCNRSRTEYEGDE